MVGRPAVNSSADHDPEGTDDGFARSVDRVLRALEPGDVVTYGEVAAEAGRPGAARAVGRFLAVSGGRYPWWRVVAASGRLAPGKEEDQRARLSAEGVEVVDGRVAGMRARRGPSRGRNRDGRVGR
ncbi:MAG: MGMT family protein [Acidimicrobiales bacterium]|nr:MGMT family protein [Acidimicrobiales bacterium]